MLHEETRLCGMYSTAEEEARPGGARRAGTQEGALEASWLCCAGLTLEALISWALAVPLAL